MVQEREKKETGEEIKKEKGGQVEEEKDEEIDKVVTDARNDKVSDIVKKESCAEVSENVC